MLILQTAEVAALRQLFVQSDDSQIVGQYFILCFFKGTVGFQQVIQKGASGIVYHHIQVGEVGV